MSSRLTSNLDRKGFAGNVLLSAEVTGLPTDSVVVPLGLEIIDRSRLAERTGKLARLLRDAIDDGLRSPGESGHHRPD
ncbi:MAG: hypothetical protein O3B90_10710 [Actinomycetota bacterium]|nr:hypothetical protein [Actinomycetota bacterium]